MRNIGIQAVLVILALANANCGGSAPRDAAAAIGAADALDRWLQEPERDRLESNCSEAGGWVVDSLNISRCTNKVAHLTTSADPKEQDQGCDSGDGGSFAAQCLQRDANGQVYFNDGPSVPQWLQAAGASVSEKFDPSRWTWLAWDAGVNHDHCYHHNSLTRGLTREDCDQQFLSDLSALCATDRFNEYTWFSPEACRINAAAMFAAVRAAGDSAWRVMDTDVAYPAYKPLWRELGLPQDVTDQEILQWAEKFMLVEKAQP